MKGRIPSNKLTKLLFFDPSFKRKIYKGSERMVWSLDRYAAPRKTPTMKNLFLSKLSINAARRKKVAVICPKYQDEPLAERNQIILPKPTKLAAQSANFLSFLNKYASLAVRTTIPAPTRWAMYCCGKLAPNKKTKGIEIIAGIGE